MVGSFGKTKYAWRWIRKAKETSLCLQMNMAADLEHVTDIAEIGRYGVLGTPALVINRDVKAVGTVPPKPKLKKWLRDVFAKTVK